MPAKEMTVRACQQGGFVVYDRIQMVQNPEPLAAFTEIRPALAFVLKAMVPVASIDPHHQPLGLQEQHLREVEQEFPTGRPVPRDEPLMEDDRS